MNTVGISSLPRRAAILLLASLAGVTATAVSNDTCYQFRYEGNPLVRHKHTADPAVAHFKGRDWFFSHIGGLGGGSGSRSVINIPGTDEWRIVYHRINRHYLTDGPGIHRQVCIDRMAFNPDGTIKPVQPTR